jgi:hypothetical protein
MLLEHRLKEGDVIYTNCVGNHLCYHLGIVYQKGDKKFIFHNAPTNNNKFGGTIVSERLEEFMKGRDIIKIVKTKAKNEDILSVTKRCRSEVWDTFLFNCEDYVVEIVEGSRKSDLRDAWKIGALGIALISLY